MRMPTSILALLAATLLVSPICPQEGGAPASKEQSDASVKKVKELRKERIAVLKNLTEAVGVLYKSMRTNTSIDDVFEARQLLIAAELEAAETEAERVELYKNLVAVLKQQESLADQRVKATRGTMVSVLKVKAKRLEAEIHLEQAKANLEQTQAKMPEVKHQKIVVTSPRAKDIIITQQYVCQIHSHHHIKVRSLQKGYLEEIPVKEGQVVKKGAVLFKILPTLYKAKLDAELAEALLAELEFKNTKKLYEQKVIGPQEVALYEAKLARARAKAELAKAELNFTEVRAPFDGRIGRQHEQQGSLVKEGDVLTTLSDNSVLWVYFNVPEIRYLEYKANPGKEWKIELVLANGSKFADSNTGKVIAGKISANEADFNNESGTVTFRADFPNPEDLLRNGMTGKVLIHRTLTNAIVIPQRATFEILDQRYVYVVDKGGLVHQRKIIVQNEVGDLFVVTKGVGVDDRIILEGIRQVRDGEKVEYEFRPPK